MWTDERVEQLKSLWTEGLSASQIARVLGGVTRNAVIGKVHRLGLAGRASPSRSERPRLPLTPKVSMRVHAPEPPVVEEDPVILDDGNFATVLTINDRMCRWPIGDPARTNSISAVGSPRTVRPIAKRMRARPISRSSSAATAAGCTGETSFLTVRARGEREVSRA
jgi:GcrA cell cycle regulator